MMSSLEISVAYRAQKTPWVSLLSSAAFKWDPPLQELFFSELAQPRCIKLILRIRLPLQTISGSG